MSLERQSSQGFGALVDVDIEGGTGVFCLLAPARGLVVWLAGWLVS